MVVCHCFRVNDLTIRRAVEDGAASISELAEACNAGADCGGCHDRLEELLGSVASSLPLIA